MMSELVGSGFVIEVVVLLAEPCGGAGELGTDFRAHETDKSITEESEALYMCIRH